MDLHTMGTPPPPGPPRFCLVGLPRPACPTPPSGLPLVRLTREVSRGDAVRVRRVARDCAPRDVGVVGAVVSVAAGVEQH
eukprot:46830-Chlamydomonas_euryale.AAC.1